MYQIKQTHSKKPNKDIIEIYNSVNSTYTKILLKDGARIQELVIGNHHIIKDMKPLEYSKTYASSILFPFANRIKDGRYEFEDSYYQFDVNEEELNNALHGLVYDKTFQVINIECTEAFASVKLVYHESKKPKGFPYTYSIYIEYILTEYTLGLNVEIKNTDSKIFPFTLGWHPYFLSNDLYNSSIIFDSNQKLKFDSRNITEGIEVDENYGAFKIEN